VEQGGHRAPRVLAWVLPIVIVLVGLGAIRAVAPPVDTELRDELVEAMAERPEVVVIGNSITKAAIDPDQLGEELGLSVALLTVPGSEAPAWYAVLKNVVMAAAEAPRLVLVANRADGLLAVSARTEQDRLRLDQLVTAHEPVLVSKVLDRDARSILWAEFDRRRVQHRRAVLDWLRDGAAALAGRSRDDAISAHNRVFAEDNLDYGLARGWTPPDPDDSDPDGNVITDPEASLVGDLADLTGPRGVKLAFVHVPSAPGVPDLVTEDQMHGLVRLMNERDVGYVERPRKPLRAAWFADPVHFRPVGREHFTRFLARRIQKLKLHLPRTPVPDATLPLRPPTLTRTGPSAAPRPLRLAPRGATCVVEGPAAAVGDLFGLAAREAPVTPGMLLARGLPPAWPVVIRDDAGPLGWEPRAWRLRRTCAPGTYSALPARIAGVPRRGAAAIAPHPDVTVVDPDEGSITWVVPGSELTVRAADPWTGGPPAFLLLAQTFGPDEAPMVEVDGVGRVPLETHGGLWRAFAQGGPENWTLTVRSAPGGPLVALHSLTVGLGARRTTFLASGRNERQAALDLVGRPAADARPEWRTHVPAVPGPVDLVWSDDGTAHFEAPEVIDLTDRLTGRCSPLAVLEDGQPLERHVDCEDVRIEPGTQCHAGAEVQFHPRPEARHARYTLAFDRTSGRACSTALWLLPRDAVEVGASRQEMRRFFAGPTELHLTARRFGPPPSKADVATVTLTRGEATLLRTRVRLEELEHGVIVPLERRIGPLGEAVRIAIENHSPEQAVLFQKATLVEALPAPRRTARNQR